MSAADRAYYAGHVMERVNQIQMAVIGIGIAILAINYLGLVTADISVLKSSVFWQRVILLLLVIVFSSYTALVYNAYPVQLSDQQRKEARGGRPTRIFALFLLDIFMVTLAACMFGVLFIADAVQLLASPPCAEGIASRLCLGLPLLGIEMIFLLGAAWHLLTAAWYAIADGIGVRDVAVHLGFSAIYVLLAVVNWGLDWFGPWLATASFALILTALFMIQGRRWLAA